jgi:hypothetical protein
MNDLGDNREVARTALEQVCARGDMRLAPRCYAEDFADPWAGSSTAGSRACGGRRLFTGRCSTSSPSRLWGITISRLKGGRIVEDWSAFDSLELLRQLGLWRTVLAALRLLAASRRG